MAATDIVTVDLSVGEATALTQRITLMRDSLIEGYDKLVRLVTEAYERRAWAALGFDTWDAYAKEKLQLDLARDDRKQFTIALAEVGMSSTAIAPIVNVSSSQIRSEVASHWRPDEDRPPVQGVDGKSYSPPEPRKPRRKSFPDQFNNAMWVLRKTVELFERLTADDRFEQWQPAIDDKFGEQLQELRSRLTDIDRRTAGREPGGTAADGGTRPPKKKAPAATGAINQ